MPTKQPPRAEVIAVGSELLGEGRAETNSLLIARYLAQVGIEIRHKIVVGDDAEILATAVQQSLDRSALLIITGGLGPTEDDITREVVANLLGRELRVDSVSLQRLKAIYGQLKLEIKTNTLRQVTVPRGADVLHNEHGTAPGLLLRAGDSTIFLLPGPPHELQPMFENQVMERIRRRFGTRELPVRNIRLASLAESAVDARVLPILAEYSEIEYTILSSPGLIELIFRSQAEPEKAHLALDSLQTRICQEMGDRVFSTLSEELPTVVGKLLAEKGWLLATAESCTAGSISRWLTDASGSSSFFAGGVIAYSDRVKIDLLGVSEEILQSHGAVSSESAVQMASGVCRVTGAEVGISVTGIAGPTGGTREKAVGTVWFGVSVQGRAASVHRRFPGDRASVRLRSTRFALDWLRHQIL